MTHVATFDIGSTNFRSAVGTPAGELTTEVVTAPTQPDGLTDQLIEAVATLRERSPDSVEAVCIASTGLVDHDRGVIDKFDTRPGDPDQYDLDVADAIGSRFGVDVFVGNDVNAAALGEWRFGAGRAYDTTVYLSIGSGIGAGVVVDGTLLRGEHGRAGEVGMMAVAADLSLSASEIPDVWEAYCSGEGIRRFVRRRLADETRDTTLTRTGDPTAVDLFEAVRAGDEVARSYLDEITEYNVRCVASLSNVFDPGAVILGGSVAVENPDLVIDPIRACFGDRLVVPEPDVRAGTFGAEAGLVGALALYSGSE